MSADTPQPLRIVVDTREQEPYLFRTYPAEVTRDKLDTGDYSLAGSEDRVAIERKSLDDLIGCLTTGRERFERELARSRSYDLFAVVVEAQIEQVAMGHYRSHMSPHSALQSILAFQVRYGLNVVWATHRQRAEEVTYHLLRHYLLELEKRYKTAAKGQKPATLAVAEVSHG